MKRKKYFLRARKYFCQKRFNVIERAALGLNRPYDQALGLIRPCERLWKNIYSSASYKMFFHGEFYHAGDKNSCRARYL